MKPPATSTFALLLALGCDPRLPLPHDRLSSLADGAGGGGGAAGLAVVAEPPAPIDALPPVLRLRASLPGTTLDPARLALVQGTLVPLQLHQLRDDNVSAALAKRIVRAVVWSDADGVVLAPEVSLEPGATYTLVAAEVSAVAEVKIMAVDTVPLLTRIWPPEGASGTAGYAVWCGDVAVPRVDAAAVLAPGEKAGRLRRGAVPAGAGERCVRLEADSSGAGPLVPPPVVASADDPSVLLRLDPRPLRVDGPPRPAVPLGCEPDEQTFGPGCAKLADDRIVGRTAAVPLLWAVAGAGAEVVVMAGPGDPFVISGLPPSTDVVIDVAAVDNGGTVTRGFFVGATSPPMPHVVLNEVLANPLGAEPAQEWVELVNDGPAPAVLDGYTLVAGNGVTALPSATLPPGAFALLVDDAFVAGGADVAPAPGTLLLAVPHLGKQGLSNSGVALTLLDAAGKAVSRFPAEPKPKEGWSVARLSPCSPDALAGSFARAAPTPGWRNAP